MSKAKRKARPAQPPPDGRRRPEGEKERPRFGWARVGFFAALALILAMGFVVRDRGVRVSGPVNTPAQAAEAPKAAQPGGDALAERMAAAPLGASVRVGLEAPKRIPAGTKLPSSWKRPTVLYLGTEFCPYCAAERWALVLALSRFGTFSGLGLAKSASDDVYPGTVSFSFHGAKYESPYVDARLVEMAGAEKDVSGQYPPLDQPSQEDLDLAQKLDPDGGIPLVVIGDHYWIGSQFDPSELSGKTWEQVASEVASGKGTLASSVIASAEDLTAAICEMTGGKPDNVCSAPEIKSIQLP